MSLPVPVGISDIMNMVGEQLTMWADPRAGKVFIMANLRHLWEHVYRCAVDDAPQILLAFNSETIRSGDAKHKETRVDREFVAVVMRGHGFRNKMAKDDEGGGADQTDDFYTHCEQVRDQIRVILSISEEFPVFYKGMRPLPGIPAPGQANVFLDAYQIIWTTANDLGEVRTTPPGEPTPTEGE